MQKTLSLWLCLLMMGLAACSQNWNNPYPAENPLDNTLYSAFLQRPKHLDPIQSYTEDEALFLYQIVEPPLQYHYLKRPHEIIPATAVSVPHPIFYDAAGNVLPEEVNPDQVAYSVYEIQIKSGIFYQPHPAFAKKVDGSPRYYPISSDELSSKTQLKDFTEVDTRELEAKDYLYQIKRLAHPRLHSPLLEQMNNYIVGLKAFAQRLDAAADQLPPGDWLDLDQYDFEGIELVDKYTYRIRIQGVYPQMLYWLTMHFFSPMPREADRFFSQPGMAHNNLTLDWYPVGTGPYYLAENSPDRRMVLERNPNFRAEYYPTEGMPEDAEAGLLADAGKRLPFIDRIVFTREKESIPYWNKFLQGYYDASGISASAFDQVLQFNAEGDAALSPVMKEKNIRLLTSVRPTIFYTGFNMRDPIVGGNSEQTRYLRQAIAIAFDQEEYNVIFLNGRGISAQGPIPPGIFGYREGKEGFNPVVYDWVDGEPVRKSIEVAKALLAKAGYPNGRDAKTGKPLVVTFDTTSAGLGDRAMLDWIKKQFDKLNIQLVIQTSDFNRFQDKIRTGNFQMYRLGWHLDYPDPENLLFLLDGQQSRLDFGGENTSNYANPQFDAAFNRMKTMENTPERQAIIDQMVKIVREDTPWIWGFHPQDYMLVHGWVHNRKVGTITPNTLKYQRLDTQLRAENRLAWNRPAYLPLILLLGILLAIGLWGWRFFSIRGNRKPLAADCVSNEDSVR